MTAGRLIDVHVEQIYNGYATFVLHGCLFKIDQILLFSDQVLSVTS